MIKRTNSKILWATVLVWAIPVFGQTDQGVVRLNLKDASRNGPPDTLPVYVEVATVQSDVEQGIVFTLNIENNGSQTIKILDPVDRTAVYLYSVTLHGYGVNLRNTRPDSLTCRLRGRTEQQLKAYYADKQARRAFQAFDSEDALRDQRMKTVSDIVPWDPAIKIARGKGPLTDSERFEGKVSGKLTLEPGERFRAVVRITRMLANPKGYEESIARWRDNLPPDAVNDTSALPPPQPQISDIAPGTYRLSVRTLVFTDAEITTWAAGSDLITIQLGKPSGADKQNANNTP